MKKLFLTALIALSATTSFVSCSSNDDTTNEPTNTPNASQGSARVDFLTGTHQGTFWQGSGLGSVIGSKVNLGGSPRYMIVSMYQNLSINAGISAFSGTFDDFGDNTILISSTDNTRVYEPIEGQVTFTLTDYVETQEISAVGHTLFKGKLTFEGFFTCTNYANNFQVTEQSVKLKGTLVF